MQTEDKIQTGGELGIFYKFPPSHSHVIVLVDILMLKLVTFIKMDKPDWKVCTARRRSPARNFDPMLPAHAQFWRNCPARAQFGEIVPRAQCKLSRVRNLEKLFRARAM